MFLIKTFDEIEKIRKSNKLVAKVLSTLKEKIEVGITTLELNQMAEKMAYDAGATPAFKNYKGYPYTICASKNSQLVHGFPNTEPLRVGDILSIDFGVKMNGYYGDAAFTVPIGKVDKDVKTLLKITEEALYRGIEKAIPNNRLYDISATIQACAEDAGFNVIRAYVGHGIGRELHEPPAIPNFGAAGTGMMLKPGMTIAIEPMVTLGDYKTEVTEDGWTVLMADKKLCAHFEHTILITEDKPEILSKG